VARFEEGELRVKSGLKLEKSLVRPFKLHSSFFYMGRGGDRRPQSAVLRVGVSWQIVTEPLQRILTSILVYVFTITFAWFVRAVVCKTDLKVGLKIQQFNGNKIRRFFPPV
jgi:hypothetical protein